MQQGPATVKKPSHHRLTAKNYYQLEYQFGYADKQA
jgi:hypothetical protein